MAAKSQIDVMGVRTAMATTQAQAAVMDTTAAKFDHVNTALEGTLRHLLGELEGLRTAWQGAGGASFEQVKMAWAEDQRALHRALGETATAIRTSGRQYQVSDNAAADRVGGLLGGGMQLPL